MPGLLSTASWPALFGWVALSFVGVTILAVGQGFLVERALPKRRVFDVPLFDGQYRFELVGNLVFASVAIVAITAALGFGWIRFAEGTWRGVATFFALLFGFQIFYYGLHRAMHKKALIRFHRWHHRSQVTTPLTGQSMSFVEACGWMLGYVGLPVLFSRIVPLSFWGWAGYLAFNVFGNIVGHANVEPNDPRIGTRGASWLVSPFVFHALHHARWTGHFSFQAAAMDRLFGTEWNDWPSLFARIIDGKPLKDLKERGEEARQAEKAG